MAKKALPQGREAVKVFDRPIQDFAGAVAELKPQEGKLRVLISLFGRVYPLDLHLVQVEKS